MKPLIPALILADSLTACATRAPSPAKQEREIAQFNRFGKTASTQEKVQLLDELVRKTNANLAGRGNEVFESIRISHHCPRSHALDYTLATHPRFAQSLDLKKLNAPATQAKLQNIAQQSVKSLCGDAHTRAAFASLGITEMRVLLTLHHRVITQSRTQFSQCH